MVTSTYYYRFTKSYHSGCKTPLEWENSPLVFNRLGYNKIMSIGFWAIHFWVLSYKPTVLYWASDQSRVPWGTYAYPQQPSFHVTTTVGGEERIALIDGTTPKITYYVGHIFLSI